MRHTGAAADEYADEVDELDNFPVRMNASDMAFTLWGTNPAQDCFAVDNDPNDVLLHRGAATAGRCRAFTDALGWYPGVEFDGAGLFFRDVDASTVIPSRGNETVLDPGRRLRRQPGPGPVRSHHLRWRAPPRHRQPR